MSNTDASLLSIKEASRRTGLAEVTLRKWLAARRIGYVRLGSRRIAIPLAEIERLVERGTIPALER